MGAPCIGAVRMISESRSGAAWGFGVALFPLFIIGQFFEQFFGGFFGFGFFSGREFSADGVAPFEGYFQFLFGGGIDPDIGFLEPAKCNAAAMNVASSQVTSRTSPLPLPSRLRNHLHASQIKCYSVSLVRRWRAYGSPAGLLVSSVQRSPAIVALAMRQHKSSGRSLSVQMVRQLQGNPESPWP